MRRRRRRRRGAADRGMEGHFISLSPSLCARE